MNDVQVLCEALAAADADQAKEDALIARLAAADALAEAAANHIADFPNPLILLDLVKALREYRGTLELSNNPDLETQDKSPKPTILPGDP